MNKEVYTIELNLRRNIALYGGGDDRCRVVDLQTDDVTTIEKKFNDSVIFCKFIDDERFIIASLDGTVSLMTVEEEINSASIDEEITKMMVVGDKILIGTINGNVHLFSLDLTIQNVCIGQYNEIKDLNYENEKVYTLSESNFVMFNMNNHQKLMDIHMRGGSALAKMPFSDVVCLGHEGAVTIRKNAQLMTRIEVKGTPECILYMNNYFIVGGDFDCIILINMPMGMRKFSIPIGVSGVSAIKGDGKNHIAFSTYCGLVGWGDIRDEQSFTFFNGGVGTIFALCFEEDVIYVGGETGFNILDLRNASESVSQEENIEEFNQDQLIRTLS